MALAYDVKAPVDWSGDVDGRSDPLDRRYMIHHEGGTAPESKLQDGP